MKFHLLTAVTRPENLKSVANSIAGIDKKGIEEIVWHLRFDEKKEHAGGQKLKNDMLDGISDGYVFILDDDTIIHPDLLSVARGFFAVGRKAIVVNQIRPGGQKLRACVENLYVGGIDAGQAVISRELIGDTRIPLHYCGDGEFLSSLLDNRPDDVMFLNADLSYHNYLRPNE